MTVGPSGIFNGLKFLLLNMDTSNLQTLKEDIENENGILVPKSFKGIPDFIVTPLFIQDAVQNEAVKFVNTAWICQSISLAEKQPIAYYYKPLVVCNNRPLEQCVISLTKVDGVERDYLKLLIEKLGGLFQEKFSRVESKEKNIFSSTHLICPVADGKKYEAAKRWGLPIVEKEWLFECAKAGVRVPEREFFLNDSGKLKVLSKSGGKHFTSQIHC